MERPPTLLGFQRELDHLLLPGRKGASLSSTAPPGPCGDYRCTYLAGGALEKIFSSQVLTLEGTSESPGGLLENCKASPQSFCFDSCRGEWLLEVCVEQSLKAEPKPQGKCAVIGSADVLAPTLSKCMNMLNLNLPEPPTATSWRGGPHTQPLRRKIRSPRHRDHEEGSRSARSNPRALTEFRHLRWWCSNKYMHLHLTFRRRPTNGATPVRAFTCILILPSYSESVPTA
ncbi:uncharacterized protein AAES06_008843 [Glossophaga mutica]